jgi:hypothetical protein
MALFSLGVVLIVCEVLCYYTCEERSVLGALAKKPSLDRRPLFRGPFLAGFIVQYMKFLIAVEC